MRPGRRPGPACTGCSPITPSATPCCSKRSDVRSAHRPRLAVRCPDARHLPHAGSPLANARHRGRPREREQQCALAAQVRRREVMAEPAGALRGGDPEPRLRVRRRASRCTPPDHEASVFVHGDAHGRNTLTLLHGSEAPGAECRLIDPHGRPARETSGLRSRTRRPPVARRAD